MRKFVSEGHGIFLDDAAGVTFTLYLLQKELKRMGHGYKIADIKDALFVCAQTKLILQTEDGHTILISSLFQTLGLQTRDDWKEHGQKTRAYVRFNPLVTEGIKNKVFRQLNYEKSKSDFQSCAGSQQSKGRALAC